MFENHIFKSRKFFDVFFKRKNWLKFSKKKTYFGSKYLSKYKIFGMILNTVTTRNM